MFLGRGSGKNLTRVEEVGNHDNGGGEGRSVGLGMSEPTTRRGAASDGARGGSYFLTSKRCSINFYHRLFCQR